MSPAPITVPTKNEAMYQALRQELLMGELKPGQRLVVSDLAKRHNVSPMPVREALKRLQQEGLVDAVPHIGAVVKTLDFAKYREVVEVRNQLEILAAVTATERFPAKAVKRLHSLIGRMEKAAAASDVQKFMALDQKFHFTIYGNSPNGFLVESVVTLWDRCGISPYIFAWDSIRMAESHKEHLGIVEAVEKRDAKLVGELIRQHKERSLSRLRLALNV